MALLERLDQETVISRLSLPAQKDASSLHYLTIMVDEQDLTMMSERPGEYLAAILFLNGRWVLMSPPTNRLIAVNHIPMIALKILEHQDHIQVGDHHLRFVEQIVEIITADARLLQEGKACPWCSASFQPGDEVIYCPNCGRAHHLAHWNEAGKCGSFPFCGYVVHHTPDNPKTNP